MRVLLGAILLVAGVDVIAEESSPRGRLCLRAPGELAVAERCQGVEGEELSVNPAERDRVWAWYGADLETLHLGTLPAGETRVSLSGRHLPVSLEIEGVSERSWPQTTVLVVGPRDRPGIWRIELAALKVDRLRQVLLPPGTWSGAVKADRHEAGWIEPFRLDDEAVDLGEILLDPLPQIRGELIDREGEPLLAAVMIAEDGTPLADSGYGGEIVYEVVCDEDWGSCLLPEWFRLEYPGTAPLWYRVTNRDRDVDLGVVRMAPGGALDVTIDRGLARGPIFVEIVDDPRPFPELDGYPILFSAKLASEEDRIVIENLPEGVLRLVVRGERAGEYYSEYFAVRSEELVEMEVVIEEYVVTFEVTEQGDPAPGVAVQVEQIESPHHVSQTGRTDRNGKAVVNLWQPGEHRARLVDRHRRGGVTFRPELVAKAVAIEAGDAGATGLVVDVGTDEPIPGVALVWENEYYQGDAAPFTTTDENGEWQIEGLTEGIYEVRLRSPGYLDGETSVRIGVGRNSMVPWKMGKGARYTVTARWEDGTPIEGAALLWANEMFPDDEDYTDGDGVLRFRHWVPGERPVRFWIVPREGSFAEGELFHEREIEVVVPPPSAPVELRFVHEEGDPIDFVHVYLTFYENLSVGPGLRETIELVQNRSLSSGPSRRLVIEGLAPGSYGIDAVHALSEGQIPRGSRRASQTIYAGPVEVTETIRVRRLVRHCVGDYCFYR